MECGRKAEGLYNITDLHQGCRFDETLVEVFAFSKSLRCRPHSSSVRKTVLWDRFSDSFSPGEAILRRVTAAWIERKPVGNAVPGVPGDRKGRPYAIRTHRRGGALTRPPPQRGGKNPLPRGKRFCATRWAVQKDGRTTAQRDQLPSPSVIARSEATWQSPAPCIPYDCTDSHRISRIFDVNLHLIASDCGGGDCHAFGSQ